ncbi:M15 family metallopeptidase [Blastococcus sp. SYSU D00820]
MTTRQAGRGAGRGTGGIVVAALLVAVAAVAAVLGSQSWTAGVPAGRGAAVAGPEDGVLPEGATVDDDGLPGIAHLDPVLLGALRRATVEARAVGIELTVTSGWRSERYQEQLLREAVAEYGSAEEAARWVAPAETSAHVSGDAVDIGPSSAISWLSQHGAGHGLCQVYANEPWHVELRPEAVEHGCPPMYADPTEDPRTVAAR